MVKDCQYPINTFYNIITKVFANKIKPVINIMNSPFQSTFILGRYINDKVLFSHKFLKWSIRKGLSKRCVLNVHLSKAYDFVKR